MKQAVLFIGHGARNGEANDGMLRVMELVRARRKSDIVEAAFLELSRPLVPEAIDACVAKGAEKILLLPYFLHLGTHVQQDLPRLVAEGKARHPQVAMVLAPHLGFHPKMAEIVLDRIGEADDGNSP